MDSIENYLTKIETYLKDIIAALAEKEVTAPSTLKVSEIASYIDKIGA